MKSVCRRAGIALVLMGAMVFASVARAQVLKQVPKDASLVVKMNDLAAASAKVNAMAEALGVANLNPAMSDPLGFLKQTLQIKAGLKDNGEVAVAMFVVPAGQPTFVGLVPVSDYAAFIGNWGETAKEGDVDVISKGPAPVPLYCMKWGDYAAITISKDLLGMERGLEVGAAADKLMKDECVSLFVNVKALRPLILPQIQMAKQMFNQVPPAGGDQAQMAAALAMMKQAVGVVEQVLTEGEGAVVGLNLVKDGVVISTLAEFTADGEIAKALKTVKNTDADLLRGLPDGKYAALVGWSVSGGIFAKFVEDFYFPMFKAVPLEGADAQKMQAAMDAMKAAMDATTGQSFALLAPKPEDIQQNGVLRGYGIGSGDAKAIIASQRKINEAQDLIQKISGMGINVKVAVKPDAKTIDGVSLDETSIQFNPDANNPVQAQQAQIFKVLFGQNMTVVTVAGMVTDKAVITAVNLDDQQIQALIAAVKQGISPSNGAAIKAASSGLPQERIAVSYIYAGQIAQLVGAATGNKLPDVLGTAPPIGMSMSVDGSAVRGDAQVPMDLLKVIADLAKQQAAAGK